MACGNHIGSFPCCSVINSDNRAFTDEFALGGLPTDCVIITDPPYGISHPCNFKTRGRDRMAACSDYDDVVGDAQPFDPAPILSLNVPTVIWGANYFSSKLPDTSGWLVWDKNRPDDLDQATCELAWTNFVKGARRFKFTWHGMIRASDDTLIHPTQKPVELTRWILSNCGCQNGRHNWVPKGAVIDLYAGSGSALVAAKQMERHYLGFELSKDYCERAEQWLLNPNTIQSKHDAKVEMPDVPEPTAEEKIVFAAVSAANEAAVAARIAKEAALKAEESRKKEDAEKRDACPLFN